LSLSSKTFYGGKINESFEELLHAFLITQISEISGLFKKNLDPEVDIELCL
jgi:hypothetical protein